MRSLVDWVDKRTPNITLTDKTEAATVFNDPLSLTYPDPDHSHYENRYITIGLSQSGKIIILSHTDRNNKIHIISARIATRQERKFYEEGK